MIDRGKHTKNLIALLSVTRDLGQGLIDDGIVDESKLRLTVPARKKKAKELTDLGMSQREVARQLDVAHTTIRRDLGMAKQNVPKNETNSAAPKLVVANEDDEDAEDAPLTNADKKKRFLLLASGAIEK
jgi:hypothetical protein